MQTTVRGKILPNASLNILRGVWEIDVEGCWTATSDPNLPLQAGALMYNQSWNKNVLIFLSVSICNFITDEQEAAVAQEVFIETSSV